MKHKVREERVGVVISFEGDVDLQTSPNVRKVLLDYIGRGQSVVVDLSRIDYIDSSGVASLVEGFQTARKGGYNLVLASVSDGALRVLKLARLDKVFTICDSIEDGLAVIG